MSEPMEPRPHRVVDVTVDTYDTSTLTLAPLGDVVPFAPGQFNMVYVYGVGECAISVSSDPARPETLAHTIRRVGNVTDALHRLVPGQIVGVRGPFGAPWPVGAVIGRDVVVVAGGLGLAPVKPVVHALLAARERIGRLTLLVGARTTRDLLFPAQLISWIAQPEIDTHVSIDMVEPGWNGPVGFVTEMIEDVIVDPSATTAFVCGPELMMLVAGRTLVRAGVDPDEVHVSLERNMDCGIGLCGHCQLGPLLVCRDGPVVPFTRAAPLVGVVEL